MKTATSYGIIPLHKVNDEWWYLLVHHRAGHWSFPKGHSNQGESLTNCALREFREETGITSCRVVRTDQSQSVTYDLVENGLQTHKTVTYYVGIIDGEVLLSVDTINDDKVTSYKIVPYQVAWDLATHKTTKSFLDWTKKLVIDPRPVRLQEVDIPFTKDDRQIWALDLPVETLAIDELVWHFEYPFWEKEGTDDWNLTPRELLDDPDQEPTHWQKIQAADLSFPLQIMWYNGRWLILDGLHRLVKAYLAGKTSVAVRKVRPDDIVKIQTGLWSDRWQKYPS